MNCTDIIEIILSAGRVSILLLALLTATLSIYLGWRLYQDKMRSPTAGELSWSGFKLSLSAATPGIFLALFGAFMVISIVNTRLTLGDETTVKNSASHTEPKRLRNDWSITSVADRADRAVCPPGCIPVQDVLVRRTYRQLYSGGSAPTAIDIESSLDQAVAALNRELNNETDVSRAIASRSAIRILTSIRDGIVKER